MNNNIITLKQDDGNTEHIRHVVSFDYDVETKTVTIKVDMSYDNRTQEISFDNVVKFGGYIE